MNILRIASEIVALNTSTTTVLTGPFVQSDEAEITFDDVILPAISGKLVGLLSAGEGNPSGGEDEQESMESFMGGTGTSSLGITVVEKSVTKGMKSLDPFSPDDADEMDFDWEVSHIGGFKLTPEDSKTFNEAFAKTQQAKELHNKIESKLWDMPGDSEDFDDIYLDSDPGTSGASGPP